MRCRYIMRMSAVASPASAPLDRYGGYLPSFAPAMMQQMMNPVFDRMRTQCMPAYHGDGDTGGDTNSPTIASPQ